MVNVVAIIARAGSKGLKGKALIPLAGKPMIAWTIEHALGAKLATAIALTSDGETILDVGRHYGIEVFTRPTEVSSDTATIDSAVRDMILKWEAKHSRPADNVVILYGNIPLRPADLTDRALAKLTQTGCDSVQSVYAVGKVHPFWMKKLGGPGGDELQMYQDNHVFRRQDLPPVYMLDGGIIALTRKNLFNHDTAGREAHRFLGADRRAVITQYGEVVDIDDELDLAFAQAVMQVRGLGASQSANAKESP